MLKCSYSVHLQIIRAEVKMTNFMVEHNIPFATTDHLSLLLGNIFPDSQIAKGFSSARTKTSNSSWKTHGAAAPRTQITWVSFLIPE